jgi:curved DNA-binding protein CbpA
MLTPKKQTVPVNPYEVLGVDRKAGLAEIKRAYFTLVREFPPEDQPEKFEKIRNAYDRLKSPESRAAIDMFLLQPPPDMPDVPRSRYDLTVHPEDLIRLAVEFRLAELDVTRDFRDPDVSIKG